jgi:acyl-CoA reductase-like NAD-dependent aldehyde dehydrogenase
MSSDAVAIQEFRDAFDAQRKAFLADPYPSIETRAANLQKIAGMLMIHRQEIRDALKADFGSHPEGASDLIEVLGPAGRATYAASQLEKWMADDERWVDPKVAVLKYNSQISTDDNTVLWEYQSCYALSTERRYRLYCSVVRSLFHTRFL